MKVKRLATCFLIILFYSAISDIVVASEPTVIASEMYVNSDNLTLDQTKNIIHFEGKVILWFNDMVLKTDKIEIIYKKLTNKKEIDKIIIPNKLIAIRTLEEEVLIAGGAEYFANISELILTGNVKLQHKDDIIKTERLIYHTKLKKIK